MINPPSLVDVYMHFLQRSSKGGCVLALTPPVSFILSKGMVGDNSDQNTSSDSSGSRDAGDDRTGFGSLAEDVIEFTQVSRTANSRIVIQAMSQNGTWAYQHIMKSAACSPAWKERLMGVCYDSAPVKVTYNAMSTAIFAAFGTVAGSVLVWGMTRAVGGRVQVSARYVRAVS